MSAQGKHQYLSLKQPAVCLGYEDRATLGFTTSVTVHTSESPSGGLGPQRSPKALEA